MFPSHPPILLADDDPSDIFLITRAFRKAGFENPIHAVETTPLALKYLKGEEPYSDRSMFPQPGLVILDSNIPGKPHEALLWIREQSHLKNLPVIVFSGSENPGHKSKALELGASAYHIKPQAFEAFVETIKRIGEYWLREK